MRICYLVVLACCCAVFARAQAAKTDTALLQDIRAKYDAPFAANLQSFDCAVDFSWKQHFAETLRVGDEGTDEELEKSIQPIHNRVSVTRERVNVSSGLSDDAIKALPRGGMAEYLLQHAVQKSLYTWLPAGMNMILPDAGTPVVVERSASGYKLAFKMETLDVEMALAPDMRLESAQLRGPRPARFETEFAPGPRGFLLRSWTLAEDGIAGPGHRLIFSYTYQTVDGVSLPEQVVVTRESHHEVWRYKLSGCAVKLSK